MRQIKLFLIHLGAEDRTQNGQTGEMINNQKKGVEEEVKNDNYIQGILITRKK